jgi:predicted metalloprotease with PDZ domain
MPIMIVEISKHLRNAHFFEIELTINKTFQSFELQLPAWRPGRYELQNFSRNIPKITAFNVAGQPISCEKIAKERWKVNANDEFVTLKYLYYANKADAGNSFIDDEIFYVNFVNCIPHIIGEMDSSVEIILNIPFEWQVASALYFERNNKKQLKAFATSFYELYDSPTIASNHIQLVIYSINEAEFEIQCVGNYLPNWDIIIPNFMKFSQYQWQIMGNFPFKKYKFIIWILPHAFYHGVEHGSSTMITLGPDSEGDNLLSDLFGVSSHELFHAWNICKIRPAELLPYDYSKENYFNSGFVVEGITTYLGDLFLVHTNVISKDEYLKEISAIAMRHFLNDEQAAQSIAETSIDLWVDGYAIGIPNKKVSIYNKGALLALLLDLTIREKFDHNKSLLTIMKQMWDKYGKLEKGYYLTDFKIIAEAIFEENLDNYFDKFIFGNEPIENELNSKLRSIGLEIVWINKSSLLISELQKLTKSQKINLTKFLNPHSLATI